MDAGRHERGRAITDEAGNGGVGQRAESKLGEGCVDAVAQVLRRIDERAVEIEDEQLQSLHRNRAKNADHRSSVKALRRHGVGLPAAVD